VTTIHLTFAALTVVAPVVLCGASTQLASPRFDAAVRRTLALVLLATELGELAVKFFLEHLPAGAALPMHLCDWALLATAAALWWRAPRCFEVAYFWGLAGTVQGLLTPALDPAHPLWRQTGFFIIHSGIVISVLFLIFAEKMRPVPASLPRVLLWSEGYLATALLGNALTGENYGFLAHPPPTASLLDQFPQTRWLYVATINGVALGAFALLYLPWWLADRSPSRAQASTVGGPT
jgi:hypothetical integral membrane protein (TIGR02206 family)